MRHLLVLLLGVIPIGPVRADDAQSFELLDGDRVVFVGNTFIERDQVYGYLETMLTARWPDRNITFRNLGWSGDTVWGEARARFGTAADGFKHLKEHVETLKPTVIFVGYGANEAFEGEVGLPKFKTGLDALLDMLAAAAMPNARIILLSPLRQENLGRALPDPERHNLDLKLYRDAIREVAGERHHSFVDLYNAHDKTAENLGRPLTDNGIHLTAPGYWNIALEIGLGLGVVWPERWIEIGQKAELVELEGTEIVKVESRNPGLRFESVDQVLPLPPVPLTGRVNEDEAARIALGSYSGRMLIVKGLVAQTYTLTIDGKTAKIAAGIDWGRGRTVATGPEVDQAEQLRKAIIEKNRLYFHRWRPQNETYLFGFRKHEQGQNAAEVPKFDPLIEELEAKIAKLRVPVKHTYELIRRDENRDD